MPSMLKLFCEHAGFDNNRQHKWPDAVIQKKGVALMEDRGKLEASMVLTKLFKREGTEHLNPAHPERITHCSDDVKHAGTEGTLLTLNGVNALKPAEISGSLRLAIS